jgi:hypothetical protein
MPSQDYATPAGREKLLEEKLSSVQSSGISSRCRPRRNPLRGWRKRPSSMLFTGISKGIGTGHATGIVGIWILDLCSPVPAFSLFHKMKAVCRFVCSLVR